MNLSRPQLRLIVSLLVPILLLAAIVAYKQWLLDHGREVRLPIEGFDPRHLLSGHYLTFRVDYGTPVCIQEDKTSPPHPVPEMAAQVCLQPLGFQMSDAEDPSCRLRIRGYCRGQNFFAGIERYYIPEEFARLLDSEVRNKLGAIVIGVSDSGTAIIKELLINGTPWRQTIQSKPQ
ncbi:MAG: GDYXXLXY domain-containing protein [Magnetococcales bacterium]|nr:GDYXXLXY domain-containing protein [Magnetococcales bacterium]